MAGTYSDVPASRFAYDRDGTLAFNYDVVTAAVSALTAASLQHLNDESASTEFWIQASAGAREAHLVLYFPALRDIDAMFLSFTRAASGAFLSLDWSADSTNPANGTWTATGYTQNAAGAVNPEYRTDITAVSLTGVKALRIRAIGTDTAGIPFDRFFVQAWHLYGGYTSDLRGWNPTSDVELGPAAFDWGDIAPGSSDIKQLRIKNVGVLTAHDVTVTREALTDKTPSMVGQYLLSTGGGTPSNTVNVGDLAPGVISEVITVHRATSGAAQAGLGAPRLVAQAGTWT